MLERLRSVGPDLTADCYGPVVWGNLTDHEQCGGIYQPDRLPGAWVDHILLSDLEHSVPHIAQNDGGVPTMMSTKFSKPCSIGVSDNRMVVAELQYVPRFYKS